MNAKEAKAAMAADLARSGLTMADATKFGFELWTPERVEKAHDKAGAIWAYKIPYPGTYRKGLPALYRLRALSLPRLPFDAEWPADKRKPPKYWQPHDTAPGAYIPPVIDMKAAIEGDGRLLIVEGEKKALKASLMGFPTIGIGGVWSWKSKKQGWDLLPELAAINWAGRHVFICFDSDAGQKQDVAKALLALVDELTQRGAFPHIATVPEVEPGQKAGLDDYLVALGKDAWSAVLQDAAVNQLTLQLWKMNARYACIEHPAVIVDEGTYDDSGKPRVQVFGDVSRFRLALGNRIAHETVVKDGDLVSKPVKVHDKWIEWACRRTFDQLTYEPGQPREMNHVGTRFNTWCGLGVAPKKGDVGPWKKLLAHTFQGCPREHRDWFERWCAWPLKHLGAKMSSAVGLWGKPGRGKSAFAEKILGPIYGQNFVSIAQAVLEDGFTDWSAGKQFVLVDEVTATDSRQRADVFKKYITQKEMQVNTKFVPRYVVTDHVNYFLTSNSPKAFYVEDDDRRFFIHHVPDTAPDRAFFDHLLDVWVPNGGLEALLWHFQNELDFGDFDPRRPPPVTADKEEMIEAGRHPIEDWLRHFPASEAFRLRGGRQVFELGELFGIYVSGTSDRRCASANAFGVHVRNAGMLKKRVWCEDSPRRLVAVLDVHKWEKATAKAWNAEADRQPVAQAGTF